MQTYMKFLLILCFCAIGYMGFTVIGLVLNRPTTSPAAKYGSIVRLVADGKTFCSGTVINEYAIITAGHCALMETPFGTFMNPGAIEIRPDDNTDVGVTARVNFATPQMDQAILVGRFTDFQTRKYITNPNKLQDIGSLFNTKLVSCGYPLNGNLYCSNMTYEGPENFFWAARGVLLPGMSGGPAMLPDGTVVAINVAVHGDLSLVSPIYNLLKNINIPKDK